MMVQESSESSFRCHLMSSSRLAAQRIKADLTVTGDIGLSSHLHIIRGLYLKILLNFNEIDQNRFIILLKKPRKYGILIYFNLFVLYKLSKNNSTLH